MNMNRQELQQQLVNNVIEGMDFKTMWSVLYDFMDESYDKFSDEELMEEVNEFYPELLEESNTNWVGRPTNLLTGQTVNRGLTLVCNSRSMNKTKTILSNPQTLQDLQDFLFDTMLPADLAVDWFCEQFGVNATDEVVDFVVEAHFAFFGEWQSA